ncbi:MAG: YhdP family protein, partial [Gammaproteobacteria bacterium]
MPGLTLFDGKGGGFAAMLGDDIHIEDGRLDVRFADSAQAPWIFTPVNLNVGGGRTHAVAFALGLPKSLGAGTLHAAGELVTRKSAPAQWKWHGRVSLDRLQLSPLDRFLPKAWPQLSGEFAFDGTAGGTGAALKQASGQITAQDLTAGKSHLNRLQTDFAVTTGNGYQVTLSNALLLAPDHSWKPGKMFFGRDADGEIQGGIARIDLAALPLLAGFLPQTLAALDKRLHELRPTGTILDTKFGFAPGRIASLDLSARFADVGVYNAEGAPGFNHLAGELTLHHGMGILALDAPGFTLRMPHVFPHTVPLDRAYGPIGIAITDAGVRVAMPRLRLTGAAGLDGTIMAVIDVPRAGPVNLRLAASAAAVTVNSARALYMPTLLMSKPLADWLMHQLHGGRVSGASMSFTGEAMRFPFKHGGGHFAVNFRFRGVTLAPGPDWQPLEDLGGTVQFENAGMNATVTDGEIAGAHVVKSNVTIADFFDPQLEVAAEVAGTLPDFIAFLRASPAGAQIRNTFDHFKTSGAASTKLTIRLPIMHPARFTLAGKLAMDDAEFRYGDVPYALKQLRGSLSYDGDGPTGGRLQGSLLDAPVTLSFAREAAADVKGGKRLRVGLDGRFPLAVLSKVVGENLSPYASGSLPLHAELAVPLAVKVLPLAVTLFSNLDGLAIKLPAPAGKSATAKRPFAARLDIDTGTLDALARYADVASACAGITDGDAQSGVRAAEVILGGSTCEIPAAGYFLRGGWRKLDVGAWLNKLPPKQRGAAKPSPWTLETLGLDMRFGEVHVFGEMLKDQTIKGALGPTQMEILLAGPDLAGRVLIPRKPDNDHPIVAELTRGRFSLPQNSVLAEPSAS